jgi:hypothetical protein
MSNEFVTDEQTAVIQKLIMEIVNDPSTYMGSRLLPSVSLPMRKIRNEVIEASGGLTNEHVPGTSPKYIQSFGSRVQEFVAPEYKEAIHYNEADILYLRELGNNDPSKRGIKQRIDLDSDRLNRRLEARIEKLRWDAIFGGAFTWMGATFSYGIPNANRVLPLGAAWSTDNVEASNSADPLIDLRYWTNGGLSHFRKYKVTKINMNGNTARWILDNSNTRAFVESLGANPAFADGFSLEKVLKFAIPGCPPVEIYNGWYQAETIVGSKVTVGDALYFIPDGYIHFETTLPGGDKIGEFVQGAHLASGSIEAPGSGKFFVIDDNLAPGTKGGPGNPYMDLIAGVYGGVNLQRSFDVLTAFVGT